MKTISSIFRLLVIGTILTSCQPGETDPNPEPQPQVPTEPAPTEVGKPIGAPIEKIIGPAGGSITTPDSSMTLVIPAGALSKDTPISVQPTENKAWEGTGLGYDLSPKNLKLAIPAEMLWNYTDEDLNGSAPEAVGIAFQQPSKTWKGRTNLKVDKVNKKVTAPVSELLPTAFYESYFIDPPVLTVVLSEHLRLAVHFQAGRRDDDLVSDLHQPITIARDDVKNWRINGQEPGKYRDPILGGLAFINKGATATYIAPSRLSKTNKIAISVEVILPHTKSRMILVSNLTIEAPNYFNFKNAKVDSAEVGVFSVVEGEFFQIALSERHITGDSQAMMTLSMLPFHGVGEYPMVDNGEIRVTAMDGKRKSWSDSYYQPNGKKIVGPLW